MKKIYAKYKDHEFLDNLRKKLSTLLLLYSIYLLRIESSVTSFR